ncbi:polyprenyl synthetase family protein [Sphingobacteriales bacterium UPWRP_1]|nr:polyprenyl synthetase [Sphingobacteriales bacterium TSM_CSM]PSJ73599.1 polyprenyl synthetase family protein [Sphingobacteriales bacterium UPWRP_1]
MAAGITLNDIQKTIEPQIQLFESKFKESVRSKVPLLDRIMYYIVQRKGKQMRPMFVFFSAKLIGGITDATYRGAALIELLHTATLIHDDVVDDANERRGFFSVNALWKNKVAVLVGDYLLSKGLLLAIDNQDFNLLQVVSRAVKDMSEGELLQMERSRSLNLDEPVYFDIIRKKTASLIASACAVGFASSVTHADRQQMVWDIGEKIGIAFQIRDDLFDFGAEDAGKPKGIDIKEKKLTLPVIYAINNASAADRRRVIYTIKNQHNNKQKVAEVIDFVWKSGGIEYAQEAMHRYRKEALALLAEFPPGEGRTGLEQLIWFTIERKK